MNVFVVWIGYEDVGGVFSTKEKGEAYIDKHLRDHKQHSTWPRTREYYSNIKMTLDEPESDE